MTTHTATAPRGFASRNNLLTLAAMGVLLILLFVFERSFAPSTSFWRCR